MSQEENTNQGTPPTNIWTLADLRNSHGLSMAKLAQLIDVTPATIWQWEQKSPSELRPKAIKALKTVFSETEVDSILHPEKYFDANGNPIKPINPPPEPVRDEGLPPQQPEQKEPEGLTGEEIHQMIKEINVVLMLLSDEGKERLVQFADWLFHYEQGMRLPSVSGAGAIDFEEMWKERGIPTKD